MAWDVMTAKTGGGEMPSTLLCLPLGDWARWVQGGGGRSGPVSPPCSCDFFVIAYERADERAGDAGTRGGGRAGDSKGGGSLVPRQTRGGAGEGGVAGHDKRKKAKGGGGARNLGRARQVGRRKGDLEHVSTGWRSKKPCCRGQRSLRMAKTPRGGGPKPFSRVSARSSANVRPF